MTAIEKTAPASQLAISDDQDTWTPHQLATLQHLGVDSNNDADLSVFFHQAAGSGSALIFQSPIDLRSLSPYRLRRL